MTSSVSGPSQSRLDALHEKLASHSLLGLWQRERGDSKAQPRLWRWADVLPCLLEAGEVVELGTMTARRVVAMVSPEAGQNTSPTLFMDFQLVNPGESAFAHRHTASAIRFIVQGHGAYTTTDGEQMIMEPGDLVVQPNWAWHGHTNETDEPAIWIDALDVSLVQYLGAMFGEPYGEGQEMQPISKPDGYSRHRFGAVRAPTGPTSTVLPMHYKWADTELALEAMATEEGDPYDGVLLEYTNPITGASTLPTMACHIQMLRPGESTRRHRHTGTTLYYTFKGSGISRVGDSGDALRWDERDSFMIPPWSWHQHENRSESEPAILFSLTDRPVLQSLGLHREEGEP